MSGGFAINISGEDINKMVAQAILDSTLGKIIQESVNKAVNGLGDRNGYRYGADVESAVKDVVEKEMSQVIVSEYGDVIRQRIRAQLEIALAPEGTLVGKIVNKILDADR